MEGLIFENTKGLKFEVVKLFKIDKAYRKYYTIKFIDTGFVVESVRADTIKSGSVDDHLTKTLCGVASLGYANSRKDSLTYKLWVNMITRCYNPAGRSYKYYGAKGVTVCDRWLRYDYFLEDIFKVDGFDEKLYRERKLFLDKDLKSFNSKVYSLATCTFVSNKVNQEIRAKEYNSNHTKIAVFPDGHEEIVLHVTNFCKEHDLHRQNVYNCLKNKISHTKGFKFYYKD